MDEQETAKPPASCWKCGVGPVLGFDATGKHPECFECSELANANKALGVTPLADLQQRLAMLTAAGVRQYEDHGLKLSFAPRQGGQGGGGQDDVLAQVMKLVEAERAAAGE